MVVKECIICKQSKPLTDYYAHKQMSDGRLNKCKECCKRQSKEREERLRKDPAFVESEKERHREKYYRLGYKDMHKPTPEMKKKAIDKYNAKYPEKRKAKSACSSMQIVAGFHAHHWSYNEEHYRDVIPLSVKDHNIIHRHLIYCEDTFMYKTLDGILLDTRAKHEEYINKF